jgi:ABC-2 type transport system ATP-binding protein
VLVLDEPAAGLDPRARIELREMIRTLAAEGKAVLVSSHILSELAEMCDVVGIIERGRLLAVGTVEEIHRRYGSPLHSVEVRLLDDAVPLAQWLNQRSGISEIRAIGTSVTFAHSGDGQAEAALLKAMIEAGFRVLAFGSQRQSLENVFMQVTRGLVQ